MKILVIGYYGKLNAGDDLLQQAITELFSPHSMLFTSWFPGMEAFHKADVVVVGGGSIWPGNTFFAFGDRLANEIKKPIVVIGISAKSRSGEALEKTRSLIRVSRFFHVRDHQTADYFGEPNYVKCGPDLFWWTPFGPKECPNAGAAVDVAINLREWRECSWQPKQIFETVQQCRRPIRPWPLHFGAPESPTSLVNDRSLMAAHGFSYENASFTWHDVLSARYVIAMRFHAIQVAVRLERPVIGFDYHPKVKTFFQENGLPELCVPLNDASALRSAILRVEDNFEVYRDKIIALKHRLINEAQPLSRELRSLIKDIDAETKSHRERSDRANLVKNFLRRIAGRGLN